MLADAEAGRFEVVHVYDLTRLSRDLIHITSMLRRLGAAGVNVEPLTGDPASTETADDELAFIARGMVGQYERRKIGERVSMAARARAAKGAAPGGRYPPTGYRRDGERYVIHEPEAEVIRRIFTESDDGYSQHRIAAASPAFARRESHHE
jgi:DNA invertase Pin-like site-specific DNA recombinase